MSFKGLAVKLFFRYLQLSRRDSVDSGDNSDSTEGTESSVKHSTNVRQTKDVMK